MATDDAAASIKTEEGEPPAKKSSLHLFKPGAKPKDSHFANKNIKEERGAKEIDWICASCGFSNFGRRDICMRCKEDKPAHHPAGFGGPPGFGGAEDWHCDFCFSWVRGDTEICPTCNPHLFEENGFGPRGGMGGPPRGGLLARGGFRGPGGPGPRPRMMGPPPMEEEGSLLRAGGFRGASRGGPPLRGESPMMRGRPMLGSPRGGPGHPRGGPGHPIGGPPGRPMGPMMGERPMRPMMMRDPSMRGHPMGPRPMGPHRMGGPPMDDMDPHRMGGHPLDDMGPHRMGRPPMNDMAPHRMSGHPMDDMGSHRLGGAPMDGGGMGGPSLIERVVGSMLAAGGYRAPVTPQEEKPKTFDPYTMNPDDGPLKFTAAIPLPEKKLSEQARRVKEYREKVQAEKEAEKLKSLGLVTKAEEEDDPIEINLPGSAGFSSFKNSLQEYLDKARLDHAQYTIKKTNPKGEVSEYPFKTQKLKKEDLLKKQEEDKGCTFMCTLVFDGNTINTTVPMNSDKDACQRAAFTALKFLKYVPPNAPFEEEVYKGKKSVVVDESAFTESGSSINKPISTYSEDVTSAPIEFGWEPRQPINPIPPPTMLF